MKGRSFGDPSRNLRGHTLMNFSLLLALLVLPPCLVVGQERMTPGRFRQIAATSGDSTPLMSKLAAAGPLWTNAVVSVNLKYESGKTFKEEVSGSARTIGGNYIVATVQSKFYEQPIETITTYDEQASAYKFWALFGETVTEGQIVFDLQKKVFAINSAYGDGFTELGVGSYSDTERSERTCIFKNGVLFATRESRSRPATKPN